MTPIEAPISNLSEVGVIATCFMFSAKLSVEFFLKVMNKVNPPGRVLTDADIEEMKWKTNLSGVLDEMRKVGEESKNKIYSNGLEIFKLKETNERTHNYVHQLEEHTQDLTNLIANKEFCRAQKL